MPTLPAARGQAAAAGAGRAPGDRVRVVRGHLHSRRLPGWALPVAGGTLAIVLGVLWYTSALWYHKGSIILQPGQRRVKDAAAGYVVQGRRPVFRVDADTR